MKVLHDTVLVEIQKESKTRGGIILSEKTQANAPTIVGRILQIGNGEEVKKNNLKLGDLVLIYANIRGGFPSMPNNSDELLVPDDAILGVLEAGD